MSDRYDAEGPGVPPNLEWRDTVLLAIHQDLGKLTAATEESNRRHEQTQQCIAGLEIRTRSLEKTRTWATGVAAAVGFLLAGLQSLGKGMFSG